MSKQKTITANDLKHLPGVHIETVAFNNKRNGERSVSIDDVKAEAAKRKEQGRSNWFKFNDGWLSTSQSKPLEGGLFKYIENPPIVSFTDKYRHVHTGILYQLKYMKHNNSIAGSVISTYVNPYHNGDKLIDGTINYLVSLSSLTVIEGKLPTIGALPTLKIIETEKIEKPKKLKFYFEDIKIPVKKSKQPKFSCKFGRTWDTIGIKINEEDIDAHLDTTWGECLYFQYNNVWYKVKMQSTLKSEAKGIKYHIEPYQPGYIRITTK